MQRLEVSGAVRPLQGSLGVKGLNYRTCCSMSEKTRLQNITHPFRQRIDKSQLSQTSLKLSNSVVYSLQCENKDYSSGKEIP